MRISLFKWTAGPWEKARGFLHKDLEHLEVALNRLLSQTFDGANKLLGTAIQGNSLDIPQYVSNTGTPVGSPKWDRVDLIAGVQKRLQFIHFEAATAPSVLLGRGSLNGPGDFEQITLGPNLSMVDKVLDASASTSLSMVLSAVSLRA